MSEGIPWIVIGVLIILFVGEPDLMSAIIERVNGGKCTATLLLPGQVQP